jgi:hypothetical protein
MKQAIHANLVGIAAALDIALKNWEQNEEQAVLLCANDIRDYAWAIKEEIFKTRLLDDKITRKNPPRAIKLMAQARHVSTSLDDILDLL